MDKEMQRRKIREDFEELKAYGYEVREFTPWHYRASHPDHDIKIDIWPTRRRYALKYDDGRMGRSNLYRDILDLHRVFQNHEKTCA